MTALRRVFPVALLLLAGPGADGAGAQGVDGLLPAPAEAAYRGRKVVIDFTRSGPQVTSMSVLCQPGGGERREFQATRGMLLFDGQSTWQYLPERGVVLKSPSRGEGGEMLRPEQVRRALVSYEVRGVAGDTVAGRRSRGLEFLPRQSGSRPRRRVWLDEETGLILRSEVYGLDGRLTWLSVFEDLEYHPALDRATFTMRVPAGVRVVEVAGEPCVDPAEAERVSGLPFVQPAYLPQGFVRQCLRARRQPGYGEIQAVFGDGLSLLSLFASTRSSSRGEDGGQVVEVGHATGRWHDLGLVTGISWQAPWAHLALLGELSRTELHKVAGSVRRPELPPEERRPR